MRFVPKGFILLIDLIGFILLALHTYENGFKSDYVTILLLVFILLAPILPNIKILRYKDIELEIPEEQVQQIEESAKNIPETKIENDPYLKFYQSIYDMGVRYNPRVSLVMLRTEIENVIRNLYEVHFNQLSKKEKKHKTFSVRHMLDLLTYDVKILDKDAVAGILPYLNMFNKAAHGEDISFESEDDFNTIINSGVRILRYLYSTLEESIQSNK